MTAPAPGLEYSVQPAAVCASEHETYSGDDYATSLVEAIALAKKEGVAYWTSEYNGANGRDLTLVTEVYRRAEDGTIHITAKRTLSYVVGVKNIKEIIGDADEFALRVYPA